MKICYQILNISEYFVYFMIDYLIKLLLITNITKQYKANKHFIFNLLLFINIINTTTKYLWYFKHLLNY